MADITKVMVVEFDAIEKLGSKTRSSVQKLGPKDRPASGHIFSSGTYTLSEASNSTTAVLALVTTSGVNSLRQPGDGIPAYRINTLTVTPNTTTANTFDIAINSVTPQNTEVSFSGNGNGSTLTWSISRYDFTITYTT